MMEINGNTVQRKVVKIVLLISGAVLLLACSTILTYEFLTFRQTTIQQASILGQIIAANSTAALAFDNRDDAAEVLSTVNAESTIVAAGLYDQNGTLFSHYPPSRSVTDFPATPQADGYGFTDANLLGIQPVVQGQKRLGTLYIKWDLNAAYRRFFVYGVSIIAIMTAYLLVAAYALSKMLRRQISEPIAQLAETAQIISREKKYTVRAATTSNNDEVAILIQAFNGMLDQIQDRDAALQVAQEQLNLSLESAGIGIWIWDLVANEIIWDDHLHHLYGLKPGTFGGTYDGFEVLAHPDDRQRVRREVADSVEKDAPFDSQYRVIWPEDGSVHTLAARGKVYRDDKGKPLSMTGVCWDITDLKRAEQEVRRINEELEQRVMRRTVELEATNKELEAFTYSVAHDLRAPLRHIHGFSKLLAEEFGSQLDSAAGEYLRDILDGTENMGRLIDDLLSLGRVSRQELKRETTGLNSLVEETLKNLKAEIRGRDIQWKIDQLPFVECDPGLMKQVFANLLSNAIKYTRPRKPAVIEMGQTHIDGQRVIFVRDNGVGFNMKYAGKLFGVFQRLHRKEDFEGTGVGLATVQRILHKHGGRIWAEAELDKGATFYFSAGGEEELERQKETVVPIGGKS